MQRVGADTIVSADGDFDNVADLVRLDPLSFPTWRAEALA